MKWLRDACMTKSYNASSSTAIDFILYAHRYILFSGHWWKNNAEFHFPATFGVGLCMHISVIVWMAKQNLNKKHGHWNLACY